MEYCYTKKDRRGRLSHGFVKYQNQANAEHALHLGDASYRNRPARRQYTITNRITEKTHEPCGLDIDVRNWHIHLPTCFHQWALEQL